MKNIRKFKVLESLSEFNIGQIITKDSRSYDMYYSEDEEFSIDASIVENCPTVFEEILEIDWCIGSSVGSDITSIIRNSDGQRFKIGDNISLKDTRGWYIIDEFVIKDGDLFIVETNEDGEDKHIINVLEELEGMSLEISSNKDELFELLQDLTDFYNKTFTKINNLIEK